MFGMSSSFSELGIDHRRQTMFRKWWVTRRAPSGFIVALVSQMWTWVCITLMLYEGILSVLGDLSEPCSPEASEDGRWNGIDFCFACLWRVWDLKRTNHSWTQANKFNCWRTVKKVESHLSVTSWRKVSLVEHIPLCSGGQDSRTLYKEQVPKIAVVSVGKAPLHFL